MSATEKAHSLTRVLRSLAKTVAIMVAVDMALASAVIADPAKFVTATGRAADMPVIEGMSCAKIRETLAQIDATGYRRGGPDSINPADAPLFEYEMRLATAHYRNCAMNSAEGTTPAAFSGAFVK